MMNKQKNLITSKYQPSITEWFKLVGDDKDAKLIKEEDNGKHRRLEILRKTIDLPYLPPKRVEAMDLYKKTPAIKKIFEEKGDDFCAIRLVPKKQSLPKIRKRGLTLNKCYSSWFLKQKINRSDYYAEICPHSDVSLWSIVFIVGKNGIFGEITEGQGFQIIHGDLKDKSYKFFYDYARWYFSEKNPEAESFVKESIKRLRIADLSKIKVLKKELDARIFSGFLSGYFEVAVWPDRTGYFFDFNRILPNYISLPKSARFDLRRGALSGFTAFPGKAAGLCKMVSSRNVLQVEFCKGEILVTKNTDVRFLPLMKKAGAIITEKGSILSHASIIARELRIPCIVGVKNLTKNLKDGDLVEVDAEKGVVRVLKR